MDSQFCYYCVLLLLTRYSSATPLAADLPYRSTLVETVHPTGPVAPTKGVALVQSTVYPRCTASRTEEIAGPRWTS